MQYYNTLLKTYRSKAGKSIRLIFYDDIKKRAITAKDRLDLYNFKATAATDVAEDCEPDSLSVRRDYICEARSRAKRTVKEIIRNNFSKNLKFITFTYKFIVDDRDKVLSDIKNMCKRYKTIFKQDLKYIAVLEWQRDRHCLHIHMIVDCPFIEAGDWSGRLWQQGFIKIRTITYNKDRSEVQSAISYCFKYMSKSFETCDYYDHLYYRSQNWNTDIKKEYDVIKDKQNVFTYARLILKTSEFSCEQFDFELWNKDIIHIYDFYT